MTKSPPHPKLNREIRFFKALYHRLGIPPENPEDASKREDKGAKTVLKRAMSGEAHHVRKVYEVLPGTGEKSSWREKHIWIPVACLSVFYPQPIVDDPDRQNFGNSCWRLQKELQGNNPEINGINRRFHALLDSSLVDLRIPLTTLVRRIKAKKLPIDYPQLLADLHRWDAPTQYIQDHWAKAFWGALASQKEAQSSENDEAQAQHQ